MIDFEHVGRAPDDYWYDHEYLVVRHQVARFTQEEWKHLERAHTALPAGTQERIAYVLGDIEDIASARMLLRLCRSSARDTVLTARESLRGLRFDTVRAGALSLSPTARGASTNELLDWIDGAPLSESMPTPASGFEFVYRLLEDAASIESMQRASRSEGTVGLLATHGLVGSEEWWVNLADGTLPSIRIEGTVSAFWPGQAGDGPAEFQLKLPGGATSEWLCGIDPKEASLAFRIERRAAVTYIEQKLKTDFAGNTLTRVVTVIELGS